MNTYLQKFLGIACAVALCFGLTACAQNDPATESASETAKVRLGYLPASNDVVDIIVQAMEESGCEVERIPFDANNMPATALMDGDIDVAFGNHKPWLETFMAENNTDFEMITPYYYYSPFALYSTQYESADEFPQNAIITMPNDPTNRDRSLRMLSELGMITLKEKTGDYYTPLDVSDNPKNLEFLETEVLSTARNLDDVAGSFSMGMFILKAGHDPQDYLYLDPEAKNFQVSLFMKSENADAKWAKDTMELLHTEPYVNLFLEKTENCYNLIED